MGDIVHKHLQRQQSHTIQLLLRCPACVNASCEQMRKFFFAHQDTKISAMISFEKSI